MILICCILLQMSVVRLFHLATDFEQVERVAMLISADSLLFDLPCISPLEAEDFRHLNISSKFGFRRHPFTHEFKPHAGLDLPGQLGEEVYASANGLVEQVGQDAITGQYIKIAHKYGFETIYGHLSQQLVQAGDKVRIGQIIGIVGNTGRSTGPHLHYVIRKNGINQDPLPYCYLFLKWKIKHVESEGKNEN